MSPSRSKERGPASRIRASRKTIIAIQSRRHPVSGRPERRFQSCLACLISLTTGRFLPGAANPRKASLRWPHLMTIYQKREQLSDSGTSAFSASLAIVIINLPIEFRGMSATLLLALLLQGAAIVLLRCRLGRPWLRRPVTILVLTSVVYQGLSSVLLLLPSIREWDTFRNGIQSSVLDDATLIMSAGMLAFTTAYLLTKPKRAQAAPDGTSIPELARALDWRVLALCCVPLAITTYEGRGYNGTIGISPTAPAGSVLASSFFVLLVVLTAFSLVLAWGPRWFLPMLTGQSVILAAAGERTPVLADAITLILLMYYAGMRPSVRQLRVAAAVAVLAALAITGVREVGKRGVYEQDSSLGTRVSGLATGLEALPGQPAQQGPGQLAQAVIRVDGVAFAGAIMQAERFGQPRLSVAYVPESLLMVVPSALWPAKLTHVGVVNAVPIETADFGLQNINFLPGPSWALRGFFASMAADRLPFLPRNSVRRGGGLAIPVTFAAPVRPDGRERHRSSNVRTRTTRDASGIPPGCRCRRDRGRSWKNDAPSS